MSKANAATPEPVHLESLCLNTIGFLPVNAMEKANSGQVALLSAKAAYEIFPEMFTSERFGELKAQGARGQRLLWASTSPKKPAYRDLKHVEVLSGPETIDTISLDTLAADRDHDKPASVQKFTKAFEVLMIALNEKQSQTSGKPPSGRTGKQNENTRI